jgi:hypothetical protein
MFFGGLSLSRKWYFFQGLRKLAYYEALRAAAVAGGEAACLYFLACVSVRFYIAVTMASAIGAQTVLRPWKKYHFRFC